MNTYRCKITELDNHRINIWDAFVDFLDTTYFPGASELLDSKLIAFEYASFKNCLADSKHCNSFHDSNR